MTPPSSAPSSRRPAGPASSPRTDASAGDPLLHPRPLAAMTARAFIAGCSGPVLTAKEEDFFRAAAPWGFILFKRNIETPAQLTALNAALRATVGREAPILIDQEGGRVQRMGPPHWPAYPPGRAYGRLGGNDPLYHREIARLGARLMAHDLRAVGINVDCVPVLDVPIAGAHDVIGDRAYGRDP